MATAASREWSAAIRTTSDATTDTEDIARRDREAIRRAQTDPHAFAEIYERYVDAIHAYCYHRTHDPDLALDLTQQIFVRALQGVARFNPNASSSVRSWLFTIAHNLVVDTYRTARPVDSLHQPVHADRLATPVPQPDDQAVASARSTELLAAIARLSPSQRQVVELRLAGLTGPEIADRLGMHLAAVKSAQFRAFRLLREDLAGWHPGIEEGGDRP
jgi:RNA polymerase sigma-70 factor (ECF subfamily)